KGKKEAIDARIAQIRKEMEKTSSDYDKEKLQERLAKLTGGVAVIKVGAATEVELKEKKHRIEDALSATRAAVEEGVVIGGGAALLQASLKIDPKKFGTEEEKLGAEIVKNALAYPLSQIAENAGVDGNVIMSKLFEVWDKKKLHFGYNADSDIKLKPEDMLADMFVAGIIDPKKVTRSALENAASVAAMFLTTETVVTEIPKKDDNCSCNTGAHGMGDMGM
ncbi:chaperonin GroEL, partial [Candidatus Peregrinibacteria bacterium]|nr:chaperonin GroEL [Candidatus Peregrinibacteria bacterium]